LSFFINFFCLIELRRIRNGFLFVPVCRLDTFFQGILSTSPVSETPDYALFQDRISKPSPQVLRSSDESSPEGPSIGGLVARLLAINGVFACVAFISLICLSSSRIRNLSIWFSLVNDAVSAWKYVLSSRRLFLRTISMGEGGHSPLELPVCVISCVSRGRRPGDGLALGAPRE